MRILYVFPHPDDESFGPAAGMHAQKAAGHEIFLLTLTRGGATRQRHKLGLDVAAMGEVRYREMLAVEKTLNLDGMKVMDFPDSGLKELDPRLLEKAVREHINQIRPGIVVTYPVHGISGFHDHLVTHAVVKRVYLELRDGGADYLKRLAFITLPDSGEDVWGGGLPRMKLSDKAQIDCVVPLTRHDITTLKDALSCYETYRETIEKSGVIEKIGDSLYFEFFEEDFDPPVTDLIKGT